MRRVVRFAFAVVALSLVCSVAAVAAAEEAPIVAVSCAEVLATPVEGTVLVYGDDAGLYDAQEVQIQVPRCDCTLPGTQIPPGQLGVACATPIGGPPRSCQNVTCYTKISTPWINGVCQ